MKNEINLNIATDLKAIGIEIDTRKGAVARARAAFTEQNGTENGYIPVNAESDTVVLLMDNVRKGLLAAEQGRKNVCLTLAVIDKTEAYRNAKDSNGKPYSSLLGLARDMFPTWSKTNVTDYMNVGRKLYLPAAQGDFGDDSKLLLEQSPSNLAAMKSVLNEPKTSRIALDAIREASKSNGNRPISQAMAKGISKAIREANDAKTLKELSSTDIVNAAKGDDNALNKVNPNRVKPARTGGATANGGNSAAERAALNEKLNVAKTKTLAYVSKGKEDNTKVITDANGFRGMLEQALTAGDAEIAVRALINALK